MVYRRRPETLSNADRRPVLDAMGRCRLVLIRAGSGVRIGGPLYVALHVVTKAIDGVAKLLTGDETYYHAGGSTPGSEDGKWRDSGR